MNSKSSFQPAGLIRVLACILYDAMLVFALLFVSTLAFLLIPEGIRDTDPYIQAGKVAWSFAICYLYFSWFWLRSGQTPGMRAWHTYLTDCEGHLVNRSASVKRFWAALLSWLLAGSGYVWMVFDRDRRSLHDRLSGTCLVVKKPETKKNP